MWYSMTMSREAYFDLGYTDPDNIPPLQPRLPLNSSQQRYRADRLAERNNQRKEQTFINFEELHQLPDEQKEAMRAGFARLRQELNNSKLNVPETAPTTPEQLVLREEDHLL